MARYWLAKQEPGGPRGYSFDQLKADKKTVWDGVHNNLALKHMRDMKRGDLVLFYHTGDQRQAVGIMEIVKNPYPNPEEDNQRLGAAANLTTVCNAGPCRHLESDTQNVWKVERYPSWKKSLVRLDQNFEKMAKKHYENAKTQGAREISLHEDKVITAGQCFGEKFQVMSGPSYFIFSNVDWDHCNMSPILLDAKSDLILPFLEIFPHSASFILFPDFSRAGFIESAKKLSPSSLSEKTTTMRTPGFCFQTLPTNF